MDNITKCIYCNAVNPKWAKAHIMPRLMGTFQNQPTLLKRVCADCDKEIGACEEMLAKCTIEALFLKIIGITGRHKKSSSPFRRGHSGQPPIRMTTVLPGHDTEVRVEPIGDSHNTDILPQLRLINDEGKSEEIVINNPDCISLSEWKMLIKKCLEGKVKHLETIGIADDQLSLIKDVFREYGFSFDSDDGAKTPSFKAQVTLKGSVTYDKRYFRAVAKIAFHYYLLHSKIFNGTEAEFDNIRRFIRYGEGNEWAFFEKNKQAIAHDPSGNDRPPYYGHILRTEITSKSIAICVQLFIGHNYKPEWYRIFLSKEERMIILQTEEFGHYYRYFEQDKRTQYDGEIEKLTVLQVLNLPGVMRY